MWNSSPSIKEISPALVAALGQMTDIRKGREAKVPTKAGSSYSYKYADLADTIQSIRPRMAEHGLVVMQNASTTHPDLVLISTTILHSSGEWITFDPLSLPAGRTAQETGSAISYGRRYHLLACLGLAAEDDDGASASARRAQSRPAPKQPASERTAEEKAIREMLASMTPAEAQEAKQAFVQKYGPLAELAPSSHADALAWLEDRMASHG